MKFNFSAWLAWLLFKLPVIRNMIRMRPNQFEVSIRQNIRKMSDEDIDAAIKNINDGGYDWSKEPYASIKALCNNAGISLEVLGQWLKDEKFLREHRRKYCIID